MVISYGLLVNLDCVYPELCHIQNDVLIERVYGVAVSMEGDD